MIGHRQKAKKKRGMTCAGSMEGKKRAWQNVARANREFRGAQFTSFEKIYGSGSEGEKKKTAAIKMTMSRAEC